MMHQHCIFPSSRSRAGRSAMKGPACSLRGFQYSMGAHVGYGPIQQQVSSWLPKADPAVSWVSNMECCSLPNCDQDNSTTPFYWPLDVTEPKMETFQMKRTASGEKRKCSLGDGERYWLGDGERYWLSYPLGSRGARRDNTNGMLRLPWCNAARVPAANKVDI
jgi:hypothetical protein